MNEPTKNSDTNSDQTNQTDGAGLNQSDKLLAPRKDDKVCLNCIGISYYSDVLKLQHRRPRCYGFEYRSPSQVPDSTMEILEKVPTLSPNTKIYTFGLSQSTLRMHRLGQPPILRFGIQIKAAEKQSDDIDEFDDEDLELVDIIEKEDDDDKLVDPISRQRQQKFHEPLPEDTQTITVKNNDDMKFPINSNVIKNTVHRLYTFPALFLTRLFNVTVLFGKNLRHNFVEREALTEKALKFSDKMLRFTAKSLNTVKEAILDDDDDDDDDDDR